MDKTLGEKIKELRELHHLTQDQLSFKTGVSRSLISLWEQGKRSPIKQDLVTLAKLFEVTGDYLLGMDEINMQVVPMKKAVSVYGRIPAGNPFEAIEDIIEKIEVPSWLENKNDLFGLKVVGDSMSRIMPSGSVAVLQKCDMLENGEIGAILVNGSDATMKRFYRLKNSIVLEPDSYDNEYKPIVIEEDADQVKIIGKVIWFCASNYIR